MKNPRAIFKQNFLFVLIAQKISADFWVIFGFFSLMA
jgi:hypothetical protein